MIEMCVSFKSNRLCTISILFLEEEELKKHICGT